MSAAMDGRSYRFLNRWVNRWVIGWFCLASLYAFGLSFYKNSAVQKLARQVSHELQSSHPELQNLFQTSFYFYYEDQFLPGIENVLKKHSKLQKIQFISNSGALLFDSSSPPRSLSETKPYEHQKDVLSFVNSVTPIYFIRGFQVQVFMPSGTFSTIYTFEEAQALRAVLILLFFGFLFLVGLLWVFAKAAILSGTQVFYEKFKFAFRRVLGLRPKFILAFVVVNLIASLIIFITLTELQKKQQTAQIEKESILFSQFSTAQVMSDFSHYFYFYYSDKFLPGMRTILSTNENLVSVRIHSKRSESVLFDSEMALSSVAPVLLKEAPKSTLPPEVSAELKTRDLVTRRVDRGGEKYFTVFQVYRSENQEPLYFIEYVFNFQSLRKNILSLQKQILIDLIPSVGLGLIIAILLAQFLIGPIRKLVEALQRVSVGDFDVSVPIQRFDEVGELIGAFNFMTSELKKKKELRKFLSDSTYRQIMEASDSPEGIKLWSMRVTATVLFSDIRNFVSHCESLEAEEVTELLNDYFSEMVDVIQKHGGEIDKFIGDGLLAVFYAAPSSQAIRAPGASAGPSAVNTAIQAIHCALEMKERLKEVNLRRKDLNRDPIETGIGITHGEIISGPIGSKERKDFTVIGDVVNLASRIEKISKLGKHTRIVFSDSVEEMIRGLLDYEEIHHDKIQGKEEKISVYELIQVRDVQALLQNLKSDKPLLRKQSIELLGQSRNETILPFILEALKDEAMEVRLQAVLALSKVAHPKQEEVLKVLFSNLKNETSEILISAMISTLGRLCVDDRILELAPFLNFTNDRIVANVIEALAQSRSPKCIDLILPHLSSVNNRIKANAAMALFAAGKVEVVSLLQSMLLHSSATMRSSAAFALGELTLIAEKKSLVESWKKQPESIKLFLGELEQCVPLLISLLKDPEPMVKRHAVIALGKIRDKSSVLPIIDNIDVSRDTHEMIQEITRALRSIGSHRLVREVIHRLSG